VTAYLLGFGLIVAGSLLVGFGFRHHESRPAGWVVRR